MDEIRFVGTGKTRRYTYPVCKKYNLPYEATVIQWIMSCYENRVTTRVIT